MTNKQQTTAIERMVKMTFLPEHCQEFEAYFETIKKQVGSQPGCHGVRLLKELGGSGVYFTYSVWDSEKDLNAYRDTELFAAVWPKVKAWFAVRAEAWSVALVTNSFSGDD